MICFSSIYLINISLSALYIENNTMKYSSANANCVSQQNAYWTEVAGRLDWVKPFSVVKDVSYKREDFRIRWFADGVLNASVHFLIQRDGTITAPVISLMRFVRAARWAR